MSYPILIFYFTNQLTGIVCQGETGELDVRFAASAAAVARDRVRRRLRVVVVMVATTSVRLKYILRLW